MDLSILIAHGITYFGEKKEDSIVGKLVEYVQELMRWQKHINLTGFKDAESVVRKLIYEALFSLRYLQDRTRIIDLGSGSGATSLIFALFLNSDVYSVEKNVKKVSFQKHIKRMFRIPNWHIIHGAIEEIEPLSADAIFAKAFGKVEKIVKKADRHLLKSGILLIPKDARDKPARIINYVLKLAERYKLPMDEKENLMFIYEKL